MEVIEKIGRLAVNEEFAGSGLGTFILDNITYAFANVKRLGCRCVTVDALSSAVTFYEKNGFQFFTEQDKEEETLLYFSTSKTL